MISKADPHVVDVTLCETTAQAAEALIELARADAVAIDTETEILRDSEGNQIKVDFDVDGPGPWRVMSIAARYGTPEDGNYRAWVLDMKYVDVAELSDLFRGIRPWGWNADFDRFVIARGGLKIRKWFDGMLFDGVLKTGAYFATGGRPWYTSLENAGRKWLGITAIDGKTDVRYEYTMDSANLTEAEVRYAADDAIVTLWVGEVLDVETRKVGLYDTAMLECDAQPFIDALAKDGMPLDVEGYRGEIAKAQLAADQAAEQIAVATTGGEFLTTVGKWASSQTADTYAHLVVPGDVKATGFAVVKDAAKFAEFIAALRAQLVVCKEQIATLTGSAGLVDDLFGTELRWELPFNPDDELDIKKWISKTLPEFTAAFITSISGSNKKLVKAHDMELILAEMLRSDLPEVGDNYRQVAVVLASYRRYSRIVDDYGNVEGVVWLKPDWNVNSSDRVKDMLNSYAADNVTAYTQTKGGSTRLLSKTDSVDSNALTLIGGPLCEAILAFREHNKMVTTYGDELLKFVHPATGRIHGKYQQALVGTGRLSSHSPNMQNLSPLIKQYARPPRASDGNITRVLVRADLSQAELRSVAHMSGDVSMTEAFRSGEDLHERTAGLMFNVDMKMLKALGDLPLGKITSEPSLERYIRAEPEATAHGLYKQFRGKSKKISFGYAYGLKGASLALQLTVEGIPTVKEEADGLLESFDSVYLQVAQWMAVREATIRELSDNMKATGKDSGCDFEASWDLHLTYAKAASAQRALKAKLGRQPTMGEIARQLVSPADAAERLSAGQVTGEQVQAVLAGLDVTTSTQDAEEMAGALVLANVVAAQRAAGLAGVIHAGDLHTRFPGDQRTEANIRAYLVSLVVPDAAVTAELELLEQQVAWALGHYGSAVLATDGSPWSFESRTLGGRRRLFQVGTKDWVQAIAALLARSRKQLTVAACNEWVSWHNARAAAEQESRRLASVKPAGTAKLKTVSLSKPGGRPGVLTRDELDKILDSDEIRVELIEFVLGVYERKLGEKGAASARDFLYRYAMADRIRAMGNQYRNHPIQGLVADAMEGAFSILIDVLWDKYPTVKIVQSVHDSIVLECDLVDAKAIRDLLVKAMEESLARYCPTVPIVADGDIALSLDDKSVIDDAEVDRLIGELTKSQMALAA